MSEQTTRRYIVVTRQWYFEAIKDSFTRNGTIEEFGIGNYNDDGSCEFEFYIKFYQLVLGDPSARIEMFDDAFRALGDYSDLFDKLKTIDSLTVEQLESILIELEFTEYVSEER